MKFSAIYHAGACLLMLGILACNRSSKVQDTDTGSTTSADTQTAIHADSGITGDTSVDTSVDTVTANAGDTVSAADTATESNSESPTDSDSDTTISTCTPPTVSLTQIEYGTYLLGMDDDHLYFHELDSGKLRWVNKQTGLTGELDMQLPEKRHRLVADMDYLYLYELPVTSNGDEATTIRTVHKTPDFQITDSIVRNESIGELQVQDGALFITPYSRAGLRSIELATDGETGWTLETIGSFHVSAEWVYWNSLRNDGTYVMYRQPRSGGELIAEVASGPIHAMDYRTDRILLWTTGGAFGPPQFSAMIDESVQGFIWLVPNDPGGLAMPMVVPGYDTYAPHYDYEWREYRSAAIVKNYVYFSNTDGELWRVPIRETIGEPTVLETRGGYDDDDYEGWVTADDTAIYWLAGPTAGQRASDDDPVAVFRTCLNAE